MKEKTGMDRKQSLRVLVVMVFIAACVVALYLWTGIKETTAAKPAATKSGSAQTAGEILYPVKTFNGGEAHYYSHTTGNGVTIKYFVLKSSDGVIRAAFDACDVCWREGKGYAQKGDYMICRNCGRRFASVSVNEVQGGCNPAPLTRSVRGDQLVLQVKDILEGEEYFAFGKGK
ncbi:MAG: DUF2318 domain-containing protein [Thermodesulfobacteriota bacterium]